MPKELMEMDHIVAAAASRLGQRGDARGDGPARGRQHPRLGGRQAAADAGRRDALSAEEVGSFFAGRASPGHPTLWFLNRLDARHEAGHDGTAFHRHVGMTIGWRMNLPLIAFLAVLFAAPAFAQTPQTQPVLGDSAKGLIGSWEFSNADRDKICTATFTAKKTPSASRSPSTTTATSCFRWSTTSPAGCFPTTTCCVWSTRTAAR